MPYTRHLFIIVV